MTRVSSPFVAKQGEVFVEAGTEAWRLCLRTEAQEDQIIRCTHCKDPASQLDHFWPYYSEQNLCAFHAAPTGWVKLQWGRKWHWIEKGEFTCSRGLRYTGRVTRVAPKEETTCKRCHARIAAKSLAMDKLAEER